MAKKGKLVHEGNAFNRDYIAMLCTVLFMAFFFYGPRVLAMALVAVLTARVCDRLAALLRGRAYDKTENSSVAIALVLVLMMPVTVRFRVVIAAVMLAVMVGKEAFGGYQSYPFNPAAVGFCAAAVSWPQAMLRYPAPTGWLLGGWPGWDGVVAAWNWQGATLAAGPSMTLRNGGLPKIDFWNLLLGNFAGPIGTTWSLVIIACAVYLLVRRRMQVWAPLCFLATVVVIAFVFPRFTEISLATWPQDFWQRLQVVKFELLGGAMPFAAVFLVTEPGTLPRHPVSQVIYGVLLGIASMGFRYFGNYELGTCFGFLLVNAVSGYFDRAVARFVGRRKARRVEVVAE